MSRYLSSTTLIESVVRRASLPQTQVTFLEEDFLAFANEEMDMAVVPYVMGYHEDYFLFNEIIPLQDYTSNYAIPYRAVGNKLRDVQFLDNTTNIYEMTRIGVGDQPYFQFGSIGVTASRLRAFYLQNDEIWLSPRMDSTSNGGKLSVYYYIRPNKIVSESRVMIVTSVDGVASGIVTVDKIPHNQSGSSLFSAGTNIDFIKGKSPYKCMSIDVPLESVNTVTKTLTFADPTMIPKGLKVGDHIALAEECMVPQIPPDMHSMLAQRIAARCLEAMGDQLGLQAANLKLAEMEARGATLIDSRVDDAPFKVANRHGFLRRSRRYSRR